MIAWGEVTSRFELGCRRPTRKGRRCPSSAGHNTLHPGWGPCRTHEPRAMRAAWKAAYVMAERLNVSPWDALLLGATLAAEKVLEIESDRERLRAVLAADPTRDPAIPINLDISMRQLAEASQAERRLMVYSAKNAIDAGLADRMVRQVELEGRMVVDALDRALAALQLTPEQRIAALEAAHAHLVEIEAAPGGLVIPGEEPPASSEPGPAL